MKNDIIFIISAGNLYLQNADLSNLGINDHLSAGNDYPNYLNQEGSRIACPAISSFAITVGSVGKEDFENEDYVSVGGKDGIAPFSRTGLGMWGSIKPDVVEYGGDLVRNKTAIEIKPIDQTSIHVVNSTLHGASATGKDYGTSFSAPKVSYIASRLQAEHPTEPAQMYRALIIQSARLPEQCIDNPTMDHIRYYGYGIPNIDRALNNHPKRITFIQNGHLSAKKADIYSINIPPELRGEAGNFSLLVEVTLAFTAKTRQTRKGAHSYLSSWLEWHSSKYNERFQSFRNRTIEYLEQEGEFDQGGEDGGAIRWVLRENPAWADNGINRNSSTCPEKLDNYKASSVL
ncbi:S8 family serine peptidase [Puia sp. P3]|uniref:S8 family serine peptidase n=1 Tax=Puia sp. P3 TaxID=3423952 RepID=UPI003D66F32A